MPPYEIRSAFELPPTWNRSWAPQPFGRVAASLTWSKSWSGGTVLPRASRFLSSSLCSRIQTTNEKTLRSLIDAAASKWVRAVAHGAMSHIEMDTVAA